MCRDARAVRTNASPRTRVRLLTLLLAAAGMACGAGTASEPATVVTATSTDKAIQLDRASAPAGVITFRVVNADTNVHSLVLLKTDVAHDKIPPDPKDAARPDKTGELRETGEIAGGRSKELTVKLAPGSYVLVCNEPAHYAVGMHVPFTVK